MSNSDILFMDILCERAVARQALPGPHPWCCDEANRLQELCREQRRNTQIQTQTKRYGIRRDTA